MSFSSGTFSINSSGQPVVTGTVISSTVFNAFTADIGTGLSTCILKDGTQTITANVTMSNYTITNLGSGSARTDSINIGQIEDGFPNYVSSVGGTADVITLTPSPAITAYAAGQEFSFIASGANTTAVTVQVSGLASPKSLTRNGTTALLAGDIVSGSLITIRYDGTRFQLLGAAYLALSGGTVAGAATLSGLVTLGAAINDKKGTDVASATSTLIGAAVGKVIDVTGTTTITSFDTIQAGTIRVVRFTGALTLTHNASSLILPGAANITTANGDVATFVSLGSGNWYCATYVKASGAPVLVATQANQETATSLVTPVVPGVQQYHPSAAKVWVAFNGTGTVAIVFSYNVTSITDNGTGDYSPQYTVAFSGNARAFSGSAIANESTTTVQGTQIQIGSPATGSCRIRTADGSFAAIDVQLCSLIVFGDQ